uniref:Uncharacterized protein n=1 Tax=Molossus molossus TaxID=27622 RepID=A0A7J8C8N5_MOLMO|nr:hypothetical protein HJG59_009888 [Molossus molossus]
MSPDVLAWPGTMGSERQSHQGPGSGKSAPSSDSPLFPARFSLLLLRDSYLSQTSYNSALSSPLACPTLRSLTRSLVIPVSRACLHSPTRGPSPGSLKPPPFLSLSFQSPPVVPPTFPHDLCLP